MNYMSLFSRASHNTLSVTYKQCKGATMQKTVYVKLNYAMLVVFKSGMDGTRS